MAGAYSTATNTTITASPLLARPITTCKSATNHKIRLYPILASRNFASRRITYRKNYLRPKILKSLTKPLPERNDTFLLPAEPLLPCQQENDTVFIPTELPFPPHQENDTVFDSHNATIPTETPSDAANEEYRVSEAVIEEKKGNFGIVSGKKVLKFGGWVLGVYVLQAILSVWVFGNDKKEEKFNGLDSKGNFFMSGNNVATYFNENEWEEKISEIRAMAREVREKEGIGRKKGINSNNNDGGSEIEKEIGRRLIKLEKKRLNSNKEKLMSDSFMNYLGLFDDDGDDHVDDDDDGNGGENGLELNDFDQKNLMFKKKFRFRSPSMNSISSSPKGFSGSKYRRSSSSVNGSDLDVESRDSDFEDTGFDGGMKDVSVHVNSLRINGNKVEKEIEDLQRKMGSDAVISPESVTEMSKSLDVEKPRSLTEGTQRTTKSNNRPPSSSSNGNSREPVKRPVPNILGVNQSAALNNLWWLNLPYVLAILMRRGSDHETAGLYTLRTLSRPDDHQDAYTVAFEDRVDANNFCYLLEFYFEDLGDFKADIVPLPIKELYEGVKSGSKKVIVVKKGQLKLYAGQPFAEVEMSLLSLLDQDQAPS